MDMKKLKTEAGKIKMPAEMKERIMISCYSERMEKNMTENTRKGKMFKRPVAFAAAITLCISLAGVTAFASSDGVFSSIRKAFYSNDNALRVSEPSDYAFIPEIDQMVGDGMTLNVTEAVADSHGIRVFMDVIFENGIPKTVLDSYEPRVSNHYVSLGFENCSTSVDAACSSTCFSVENNVVSLYITADGIQKNEWKQDGITIEIENFGIRKGAGEFETVSSISESVNIPSEQIKRNGFITSCSDIDGVTANMELSLLGINITFDSMEDYNKIEDKISYRGIITPTELCIYMKDNVVYGGGENMGEAMDMMGGGSGGVDTDGKYYRYIRFDMPVDIEKIEKITLGGYEFSF